MTDDEPKDEHNHVMKAISHGLIDRFGRSDRKQTVQARVVRRKNLARREFVRGS